MFIEIAVRMCFMILTGEIDLSVGSVAAFTSVVAAYLSPYGIEVALPGAVTAGPVIGDQISQNWVWKRPLELSHGPLLSPLFWLSYFVLFWRKQPWAGRFSRSAVVRMPAS